MSASAGPLRHNQDVSIFLQPEDTQRTFVWVGDAVAATHRRVVQGTCHICGHPLTGGPPVEPGFVLSI